MPRLILMYNERTEREDYEAALDGMRLRCGLEELDNELRKTTKYSHSLVEPAKEASEMEIAIVEKIRAMIWDVLNGRYTNE